MKVTLSGSLFLTVIASVWAPSIASAQDTGSAPDPSAGGQSSAGDPQIRVVPVPVQTTSPQVVVPGYPAPGTKLEGHLPSSSRASSDTSRAQDGFDLLTPRTGPVSVRGNADASFIVTGQEPVPASHSVRRGDTLWDISARYFETPYSWPRLWAQNPQILNPHWIYPGDRLKLRDQAPVAQSDRFIGRMRSVPQKTIFLRDIGWVDEPDKETWGTLVSSPDDQMLLSYGDDVYLEIADGHDVQVGQELVVFRPLREVTKTNESGESSSKGELVSIRGTARIERYNEKTRIAKAKITEALDVIERGAKIGPVNRRFDVVPPVVSEQDMEARILASIYPFQFFGQYQVIFIDVGEKEGVKVGQRFFAIRRGDRWRQGIAGAGNLAVKRAIVEDDRPAEIDDLPTGIDADKLPDESYAELRVVRVRDHSATAIVTASTHEIERTARLVSRKGF